MKDTDDIYTEIIDQNSPYLETVINLGDANNKTLGFFPKGAFIEHAVKKTIIVAVSPQKECIGYLLYKTKERHNKRIRLVHLCISENWRKKGIPEKLVNHLKKITDTDKQYEGIGLTCRRDFNLDHFWQKLGFIPRFDKAAKTEGKENTYWWFDYGHPNLLSILNETNRESKLSVVIDAPIFFEIAEEQDNPENKDSKSLMSDWLQSEVDLSLVDEISNQINNITNSEQRKKLMTFSTHFSLLDVGQKNNNSQNELAIFLKSKNIDLDNYNFRYLQKILASETYIFVTQNQQILQFKDEFYDQFKLSILSPLELIFQIDEIRSKTEYQPIRMAGMSITKVPVQWGKEDLQTIFLSKANKEKKAEFIQKIKRFLTDKDKFECWNILENKNKIALLVYDKHKSDELEIPIIRVLDDHPIADTIIGHLIYNSILDNLKERRNFTRITDSCLSEKTTKAIKKDSTFIQVSNGWLRANLFIADTALQLSDHLNIIAQTSSEDFNFCVKIANLLSSDNILQETKTLFEIEKLLFPAKIFDADIHTFIIPIKPEWAKNLFDYNLANQALFGASKIDLALNTEAVYYKSKSVPKTLKPGVSGRIIWYVSKDKDKGYQDISSIRAVSRLDEVVLGKPQELFRRFQNLGIYQWNDVLDVAGGDPEKEIMAIKFSHTELLKLPIPLNEVQEVLENKFTMQSAYYVSKEKFAILYCRGNQLNTKK
jgi:GNAT superfamily N-acetyltransferase